MLVPPVLLDSVLTNHWYVKVPPSVTDAITDKVAVPPVGTFVLAAGWPESSIIGVCAFTVGGGGATVTLATALALLAVFEPETLLLVFVIRQ
jgi:hypothetical protein